MARPASAVPIVVAAGPMYWPGFRTKSANTALGRGSTIALKPIHTTHASHADDEERDRPELPDEARGDPHSRNRSATARSASASAP